MRPPPEATWHAGDDGLGHAYLRGDRAHPRALCGNPRHPERFDRPITNRCNACMAALNELTKAALAGPPAQLRGGW